MDQRMKRGGLAVTGLYAVAIIMYVINDWCHVKALVPNEVGDFLAGVFSPLAFLWLVLGYFQQGQELRQNNKALELQAMELHNSVKQQEKMVEVTKGQLDAEIENIQHQRAMWQRSIEPRVLVKSGGVSKHFGVYHFKVDILNRGNYVENVIVAVDGNVVTTTEYFPNGESLGFTLNFDAFPSKENEMTLYYDLSTGEQQNMSFVLSYVEVKDSLPSLLIRKLN